MPNYNEVASKPSELNGLRLLTGEISFIEDRCLFRPVDMYSKALLPAPHAPRSVYCFTCASGHNSPNVLHGQGYVIATLSPTLYCDVRFGCGMYKTRECLISLPPQKHTQQDTAQLALRDQEYR